MSRKPARLPRLVLASGSPRRRELLSGLGLDFTVRPVDLDESIVGDETPEEHVQRLAAAKSRARAEEGEIVLAADTIVVVDGDILGKPTGPDQARSMLRRLEGRRHVVLSGVALTLGESRSTRVGLALSSVEIDRLDATEIDWYVETGEPLDKAGSYAIQGLGALFVTSVDGNYTNVVGLPLPLTRSLFAELGFELRDFRRSAAG